MERPFLLVWVSRFLDAALATEGLEGPRNFFSFLPPLCGINDKREGGKELILT